MKLLLSSRALTSSTQPVHLSRPSEKHVEVVCEEKRREGSVRNARTLLRASGANDLLDLAPRLPNSHTDVRSLRDER
ncbi:hypothetical protein SKAU_G00364320 [Synaphobranchus kaupii]|uniref:Uncharacterized protein n=1 Tax=Synaphobranchus kaupii TaxID=118154 RepID=A0A9Q1EEW7_SYNKA|nr:hypothetical protein SKAU_G00364320 [Synaphobranchus kaupii]